MVELGKSDDVRKRNRQRILAVLRDSSSISRKGICVKTGLSASTVSAITSELLEENIIVSQEAGSTANIGRGRPQVRLYLNKQAALVAAIALQLDQISVTISDYSGTAIATTDIAFQARQGTPDMFFASLTQTLKETLEKVPSGTGVLRRIRLGVQAQPMWTAHQCCGRRSPSTETLHSNPACRTHSAPT